MVLEVLQEEDVKEPTFFINNYAAGDIDTVCAYFVITGFPVAAKISIEIINFMHGSMIDDDLLVVDDKGRVLDEKGRLRGV